MEVNIEERNLKIVEHLRKIRFVGPFPQGMDVLLVSINNALDEGRFIDKDLTRKELLSILKNSKIRIFRDIDDYARAKKLPNV